MKYNEQTRELTITLPEGDWFNKQELIRALSAIEFMKEGGTSQYFIYTRTSAMDGFRAQHLLPDLSLYLSYILKRDVDTLYQKAVQEMGSK